MILVDANVLLRLIQIGHPHQQPAVDSIALLYTRDREQLVSCPQVLYEMYAICTRPTSAPNPGLGLSPTEAMVQVQAAERQFAAQAEPPEMFARWKDLVVRYAVTSKSTHDARLAALMIERQIPSLLTFNDADFNRYAEVKTLNPFDVLSLPRV